MNNGSKEPASASSQEISRSGFRVLITRPAARPDPLADLLIAAGGRICHHPVIEIRPAEEQPRLDQTLGRLGQFGSIVFLSSAGVEHFLAALPVNKSGNVSGPLPDSLRVAAFGASTSALLRDAGCAVDWVPVQANSESMADCLIANRAPTPVLLIRANRGSPVLSERLKAAGIAFEELVVYRSLDVETVDTEIRRQLQAGEFDWVTITSSAIARSTARLFGDALSRVRFACISPTSADALREAGFEPDVIASEYNFSGLVDAITKHEARY